jgi:hypothetical protein
MPITKVVRHDDKPKARFFTGGKPKDFTLSTVASNASVYGKLNTGGTSYALSTSSSFNAKDLRETAEHLAELADVMDGKVTAA